MQEAHACPTPMAAGTKLFAADSELFKDPSLYRSTIGALQYVTLTRPDISVTACKRVLRYLKGTQFHGLLFRPTASLNVECYTDVDWGGNLDDRRSTSGYCVYLGPNLVQWSSRKQKVVALSSTEVEYRALAQTTTELALLDSLFSEIGVFLNTCPIIWCDNVSAGALASNPVFHARTKHIEIDTHYICDQVLAKKIIVQYVPTKLQIADILTKALSMYNILLTLNVEASENLLCVKLPLCWCFVMLLVNVVCSIELMFAIVLLGSDGIERPFLCKPKDDLRKDARMMEFTAMINRLLAKYPESRRRKLYIRTFAVIPLTEDCGMVEWVPHTRGLRHILQDIYISCGKFDRQKTNPQIKRIYDQCQGKMPEDEMLKTKILPMFPPVFHKWFLTTFSEPAAWFRARVAYAHTTAVWSMVGHIVGLGDRHGENILFDSTTGDCVHVDFSCLFDKGLQLEKPELVPFRLTQNMIDGLGITGYEGIFLKACEITLQVLRTHRETLMSVLETFIHDPLVEWTKSHKSSGVEVQNPHAQRAISNIQARLQGVEVGVGAAPSLPLGVEGQARRLIAEAVSHRNLGKMYIWWMPWF
ncbi:serine/threonine-protein kinase ATR-like [Pistacia vera]|uniref:serine/threonine-protein kinase ATR-like n=1 Tax=Pistacia vera TaxID=55513 RepID=UPI001262C086|nr:serine/threonine-protein kinase ATR-like [Pistacia vera]